jgi:hypothetical protein
MREAQKILDEIAHEIKTAVDDLKRNAPKYVNIRPEWKSRSKSSDTFRKVKQMPDRLSDLAADGSCAMRYLFGYTFKGFAILQVVCGLFIIGMSGVEGWVLHKLCVGLVLSASAQLFWIAGRLIHRSADRKRYAQYQHRLLKLAREKGGSLTVLEAATDTRITVEKSEEILRELAVRGHVEVRVSESGLMVYHFPEIERWDEKHWAKPVDEL